MDTILVAALGSVVALVMIIASFMFIRSQKEQPDVFSNGAILLKPTASNTEFLNRQLGMRRRSRKSKRTYNKA